MIRPSPAQKLLFLPQHFNRIHHFPNLVGKIRRYGWGRLERLMDADETEVEMEQGNRVFVIL
jgi:hypothetical protein